MGYGLVVGGAVVKIPQVVKIVLEKSVFGISFSSVVMEGLTNWVTIVYSWYRGNPFSIYGENVFILVQNLVILMLFITYGRNVPRGVADPGPYTIRRYIKIFLAFIVTMFLTSNPYSWPPVVINSSMVLQIMLCNFYSYPSFDGQTDADHPYLQVQIDRQSSVVDLPSRPSRKSRQNFHSFGLDWR